MAMSVRPRLLVLPMLALAGVLVAASVSVVDESQQAVILKGGQAERVVNRFAPDRGPGSGAGLVFHIPVAESIVLLDRTLFGFEARDRTVETADGGALRLDVAGRYRIIDPVRLVESLGGQDRLSGQLEGLIPALLQSEFGKLPAVDVPLPGGGGAWQRIAAALDAKARTYGVQIVDFRVRRAALGEGALGQTLERMQKSREELAAAIEEDGVRQAAQIRADTEVEAARIIDASTGRDPEFYDFYLAMRSYEKMFADPKQAGKATIILSPDNAYLRQFGGK